MVFSSVPPYIDPPNWNGNQPQQLQQQEARTAGAGSKRSSASSSMPERARLAKVPPPETALECPRCGSINTKFCYYNNYSLSQPRHFCKACRRYWTRGGILRNVPVGGRNKRSKHSKATSSSACTSSSSASIIPPPVPAGFLGPMNNNLGTTALSFSSLPSLVAHQQASVESSFPLASGGALASSLDPYWRSAQHFPLLGITGGGGVLELPPLAPSQTMPPLMQLQQLEEGAAEAEYAKIQLLETEGRPGMGLQRDDRSGVCGGRNTTGGGGSGEWTTADIINQAFFNSSSSGGRVSCNKQLE